MKHDWQDITANMVAEAGKYGFNPRRRCRKCGVEQTREQIHQWMRVVGYQWYPLAGRCRGAAKVADMGTTGRK